MFEGKDFASGKISEITSIFADEGMELTDNARSDLQVLFMKYVTLDKKYAYKGAQIAIENGWMEQPL